MEEPEKDEGRSGGGKKKKWMEVEMDGGGGRGTNMEENKKGA